MNEVGKVVCAYVLFTGLLRAGPMVNTAGELGGGGIGGGELSRHSKKKKKKKSTYDSMLHVHCLRGTETSKQRNELCSAPACAATRAY